MTDRCDTPREAVRSMQIDPCRFCGEPALERYAVRRVGIEQMTAETMRVPLCEPHREWLARAGERGRALPDGSIWWLAEA